MKLIRNILRLLQSTVRIRLALVTVIALKGHASVKRDGKDWIVPSWIKMHYNVCLIAAVTVHSTWTHKSVTVNPNGVVTIVRKVCVIASHCVSPDTGNAND